MVRRSYRVGATTFGVRTTSEPFGAWLDGTFTAYRIRTNEWPEYSVVVDGEDGTSAARRSRRFHVLYRGVGPLVRTFELSTLGRTLCGEFESRLLDTRRDAIYTYAALLSWQGVHILAPSWLGAYLRRLGRKVEKAEVSMPLATWVAIDAITGLVIDAPTVLDAPERAIDRLAAVDGSNGHPTALWPATGVHVDAVVTYVESVPGLELGSRGGALYGLAGHTANLATLHGSALSGLRRLVEGARTYKIGWGRPQQMLDAILMVARHELAHR